MHRPEVSVVLPTYNRWPFLSRALAAVLNQSSVDLEVLVIDDGSSDETPERLRAVADPRVRAIRHDANQGVARARNRGMEEASAPWIAFLDDDDFWAPERLREHMGAVSARGGTDWVYGSAVVVGPGGEFRKILAAPDPGELETGLREKNIVGPPSTVTVRTELARAVGGFDEDLSVLADWDLWIRLNRNAGAVASRIPFVAYCEHPANMQRTSRPAKLRELEYLAEKHASTVAGARRFGQSTFERWRVGNDRWAGRRYRAAAGYVRLGIRQRSPRDLMRGAGLMVGEGLVARSSRRRGPKIPPPSWVEQAFRGRLADSTAPAVLSLAS